MGMVRQSTKIAIGLVTIFAGSRASAESVGSADAENRPAEEAAPPDGGKARWIAEAERSQYGREGQCQSRSQRQGRGYRRKWPESTIALFKSTARRFRWGTSILRRALGLSSSVAFRSCNLSTMRFIRTISTNAATAPGRNEGGHLGALKGIKANVHKDWPIDLDSATEPADPVCPPTTRRRTARSRRSTYSFRYS